MNIAWIASSAKLTPRNNRKNMTQRLQNKFSEVKAQNRAALITYIMANAPDKEKSALALHGLPEAGADIIELGMPFSDPMADGPVIQEAAQLSLQAGTKLRDVLAMVTDFRKENSTTPIILMGYYNPLQNYGLENFTADAANAGVDGLLVVDLPPEEESELKQAAEKQSLAWIRLATPTTDDARLKTILKSTSGFLYYVSVTGITGTKSASSSLVGEAVRRIKKHTNIPVAVGFGIKSPEDVRNIAKHADAVVVGSAIVKEINNDVATTLELVRNLASALKGD